MVATCLTAVNLSSKLLYAGNNTLILPLNSAASCMAFGSASLTSTKPPVLINECASDVSHKTRTFFSCEVW